MAAAGLEATADAASRGSMAAAGLEATADAASRGSITPALGGDDATVDAVAHRRTQPSAPTPRVGAAFRSESGAPAPGTRAARWTSVARVLLVILSLAAAANIVYFVSRFVLATDHPQLNAAFLETQVRAGSARFGWLTRFGGWQTTAVRLVLVSTTLLVVPLVIVGRHSRNPMAIGLACVSVLGGQLSLAVTVLTSSETLVVPRAVAAAIYLLMPATGLLLFSIFPSGKPVPKWSLRALPFALAPFAVQAVHMYATRGYSRPVAGAVMATGVLYMSFVWYRYRYRATLRQRHQIKWMAYGGSAFLALQIVALVGLLPLLSHHDSPVQPLYKLLYEVLLGASYLIGIIIALLSAIRYRLWEIDRIINRTLVYGLLSFVLAAFLGTLYFALRSLLYETINAPGGVAVGISLAVTVALFAPLRRRIIRFTDRRFYGIRLDYEALAAEAAQASLPTTEETFASYGDLELLGRGGMGAVYRARHPDFDVPVALKIMSRDLAEDPDSQARFHREAHILEGVRHPNVVPFLASGHNQGLAFIAMELVEGEDLAAILRRRKRLSPDEVIALLAGVAGAIDAAHKLGIVHRDIKPSNILVAGTEATPLAERRPMLMDFGVARWSEAEPERTAEGSPLVGSLVYISPEQIRQPDAVDGRADIYSLGVTAFELVTGRPPFHSATPLGMVMEHLNHPPPDPRALVASTPDALATAILRALAKDRDDRFATARDFVAAMR